MKACDDYELLLHGLLDGELDAAHAATCEKHLANCPSCTAAFAEIQTMQNRLRTARPTFAASAQLRSSIDAELDRQLRLSKQRSASNERFGGLKRMAWPSLAMAMTACLALVVIVNPTWNSRNALANDVVAAHFRSLQVDHLVDVPTSDRHTVKPWFAGKLDFSPAVVDLSDRGFELIGGRLDYIQNHSAAALAYHRRQHVINLFIWPDSDRDSQAKLSSENGFNVVRWQKDKMSYWAVSDLNADELKTFQIDYSTRVQN